MSHTQKEGYTGRKRDRQINVRTVRRKDTQPEGRTNILKDVKAVSGK